MAMNRIRSASASPGAAEEAATRDDRDVVVKSQLDASWLAVLEHMLFFNEQQHSVRARVAAVVDRYGGLQILEEGGRLRLRLEGLPDTQTLYAVLPDGRPVGCVVYSRDEPGRFLVLHVAVEPAFSVRGGMADGDVLLRLVGAVRSAAKLTRGVRRIDLLYAAGRVSSLRVRGPAGQGSC